MAWWRWLGAVLVATTGGSAPAQDSPFVELRRWTWRSPEVVCAANDAAGTMVAYATEAGDGGGWQLVLYDPEARRETGRLALAWHPMELRCREPGHVDVRVRDSNKLLSWSHWRRVRLSDGAEVGERTEYRLVENDPVAGARMAGRAGPDTDTCVYRRADRGIAWSQAGASHAITDTTVHGITMTPDGQFVVLWLSSRVVVLPVAGGEPHTLRGRSEDVRAVVGGANGDDVLVVERAGVQQWRCGDGSLARTWPCAAGSARAAALQPGGHLLAVTGGDEVLLVDLAGGTVRRLGQGASTLAWAPDGRTLVCAQAGRFTWFDFAGAEADGVLLGEVVDPSARKILGDWELFALDAETAVWSTRYWNRRLALGEEPREQPLPSGSRLVGRLVAGGFVGTDGGALQLCDGPSGQLIGATQCGADLGPVAVSAATRRVAAVVGGEVVVFDVAAATSPARR